MLFKEYKVSSMRWALIVGLNPTPKKIAKKLPDATKFAKKKAGETGLFKVIKSLKSLKTLKRH